MSSPPDYLTEYINKIAKDEGFIDHSLLYESGSNHGDGFVGIMVAVTIKGREMVDTNIKKELSLMCKLLPENKARREFFNSAMLFEREVYVYSKVLPILEKFQFERNISLSNGFFHYPKCYLAVADAVKDHYVIVMENIKVSQYEMWDKKKPVDFHTSSIFMATLGRFHGLSLALHDQKPTLFRELLDLDNIYTGLLEMPSVCNLMRDSFDKAIEYVTSEDEINILKKLKDNYKSTMKRLIASDAAGQLKVFLHGDCWNNNLCFRSDSNIESLDDHSGRLLIKLALGSTKDWFNEFMVQSVSKAEYAQYGKVLSKFKQLYLDNSRNYAKYAEYKKKQEDKERLENLKIEKAECSESTSNSNQRRHAQRSDSISSEDERSDRRVSSAKSRPLYSHKHSSNRDQSYSISDDNDDDRKNAVRTSKSKRDSSPETYHRNSKNTSSNRKSSDDSDSDRRGKYISSSKSSHKKTKSKKHFKSRSYCKDERHRYHSSDEEDKHYKKKTKKSKRPRSRSRDRR